MKKILCLLILLSTTIMINVKAASLDVISLDAKDSGGTITYSGTTTDGVLAVSCSLYDKSDNLIDIKSTAVYDQSFTDTFNVSKGNYIIKCANYDGGNYINKEITVTEEKNNPKTGDNIILSISIGLISLISLSLLIYYKKKHNN